MSWPMVSKWIVGRKTTASCEMTSSGRSLGLSCSHSPTSKEIVRMNQELPNNELRETTTMIEKKHLLTNDKTLIVSSGGSKNKVFKFRDLNETKFVYSLQLRHFAYLK
jgi:hypothetical protein